MPPELKDAVGTSAGLQTIAAATPAVPGIDMADLKRKSVRGGAVTLGSQGIGTVLQLASTMVLARLLSPDDYGVIAMVMAVTGFARLFRDLGLSSAAIQKKDLTRELQTNLFWMNVAMGSLLTVVVAVASPLVGAFYKKPELVRVTVALSFSFVISSLGTQHGAGLVRGMKFGRKETAGIVGAAATLVVAVVLALGGYSYWALVWSSLIGNLVTTGLLFALSPFRPGLPSRGSGVRDMLKFGANITAFDFVNYFQRNLDNILIGRFWGPGPLGLYSRAYQLLMLPIQTIRGPINAVAFPAMSKLQGDPKAFRSYYLETTSVLALLSMPLTAFLFIASRPLIEIGLGRQWLNIAPIFSALALAGFIQPASGLAGSLLLSLGKGRRYLQCGVFNAVLLSASFLAGIRWGALGVAVSYAIANYVVLYPWMWWAYRDSPVCFRDFCGACAFPFGMGISVVAAGFLCNLFIHQSDAFVQLIALAAAAGTVMAGFFALTERGRSYLNLLQTVLGKRRACNN